MFGLFCKVAVNCPTAWLFVVARNQVGRAAAHQRRFSDGDPADHLHTHTAGWTSLTPQAPSADLYAARAIMHVIAGLPDNQRIATYLHHVQGWSLAEIGDYLDCAASTAGVHIHRGTKHIRDYGLADSPASPCTPSPSLTSRPPRVPYGVAYPGMSPGTSPGTSTHPPRARTPRRTGRATLILSSLLTAVSTTTITASAAGGRLTTTLLVPATMFALTGLALLGLALRSSRRTRRR